jgi:hypothetical protein
MEIVLLGYFLNSICQIFSLGGFLTDKVVVQVKHPTSRLTAVVFSHPGRFNHRDDMGPHAKFPNRLPMAR